MRLGPFVRKAPALLACLAAAAAASAMASGPEVPIGDGSNEAKMMGYYAAALSFTPLGAPEGRLVEAGVDVTYLPPLSKEDRQTTFNGSKIENTNFTSYLPRPRLRYRPAAGWLIEGGYFPETEVFGVKPQMLYGAVAWNAARSQPAGLWVRAHYMRADIHAPITCSEDAVADPSNPVCFGGQVSEDRFRPETYGLDIYVSGPHLWKEGPAWYAGAGYRHEDLQFDTHFVNIFGRLDNQVLLATLDRGSIMGGVTWNAWRGLRLAGEIYDAPKALVTARVAVSWGWGR
jgi:hypothetical protein